MGGKASKRVSSKPTPDEDDGVLITPTGDTTRLPSKPNKKKVDGVLISPTPDETRYLSSGNFGHTYLVHFRKFIKDNYAFFKEIQQDFKFCTEKKIDNMNDSSPLLCSDLPSSLQYSISEIKEHCNMRTDELSKLKKIHEHYEKDDKVVLKLPAFVRKSHW